jgi:uncharacterized membrane protein YhaH (DUF805 family)
MEKRLTIDQMKRNLADPSIWRRVLSAYLSIALFIAGLFWWPLMIAIYFAIQVWKGRRLLFSFSGRVGRKSFWRSVLVVSVWALVGGGLVVGAIQAALPDEDTQAYARTLWLAAALIPFVIAPVALCAVATGVRRLHDCDRSGAWLLALYGVPAAGIGIFILPMISNRAHTLVLFLVIFPGALWACVALGFRRGSIGPNRFGPDLAARPATPNRVGASL